MHIVFAHERFVFRHGADRVLILLAEYLYKKGHRITILCNRCDHSVLERISHDIIYLPTPRTPFESRDEATTGFALDIIRQLQADDSVDILVNGGWPFVSCIPEVEKLGIPVVFIDFGRVPSDGYGELMCRILEQHGRNRSRCLPHCSGVIAISQFILETQSRPDAGLSVPCHAILLGADHLSLANGQRSQLVTGAIVNVVRRLKNAGTKLIFNMGRWEPGCYKGSENALRVFRGIAETSLRVNLLVLANKEDIDVPAGLERVIIPLGFPSDSDLAEIIKIVDFGICMSRWEGFNLPLAEMQFQDQQALVFRIGAHPEVVADSWYLCEDEDEMRRKAITLLGGAGIRSDAKAGFERFKNKFQWQEQLSKMETAIMVAARDGVGAQKSRFARALSHVSGGRNGY